MLRHRALAILGLLFAIASQLAFVSAPACAQSFDELVNPGVLIDGHKKWDNECKACHKPFDKLAQSGLCLDCHKKTAAEIKARTGFHGRLKEVGSCARCHTDHKGRTARITKLDMNLFDHGRTKFPIVGAHKGIAARCDDCHQPHPGYKYRDASPECGSCHRKADIHKGKLGRQCEKCHSQENWKNTTFKHDRTRFKLEFGHANLKCRSCHADRTYVKAPLECVACHKKDDHKKGHKGKFGPKCETCHNTVDWKKSIFNHDRDTKYLLKGRHVSTKCDSCHTSPLYVTKTPTACVACHRKDDQKNGHKGGLGDKCGSCHNETSWKKNAFDHDKDSDFPLTGKHREARCETCHKPETNSGAGPGRTKLPTQCYGCHKPDDEKKGHRGNFGPKCQTCHTTKGWKDITFDHDRDTRYPLRGKHREPKCVDCHIGQLYGKKQPTECVACHRKDDEKKGHKGTLGTQCEACHGVNGWKVDTFDHNRSRFPLRGSHRIVECKKCHNTIAFKDTPGECYACHKKDDVHKLRLGTECETCHNARTWKSWDFDHRKTGFVLDGAHAKLLCYACHKDPMKKKTRTEIAAASACFTCHVKDDVHKGAFPNRCERCHVTSSWRTIVEP